nr:pyruvate dehydrogenase [Corynebacterium lactis]
MTRTFAQQIVSTLERLGVRRIYGLVGDSLNPIVHAVSKSTIEWIHVHNEEAAAFAAGADSLTTGQLAVCAASAGPGNTHLIQGLFESHRNGAKVLALATHITSVNIGTDYHQETRPEELFRQASGYCETVYSPEQGAMVLHHAIQSTLAGKGVSVMVIPGDMGRLPAAGDEFPDATLQVANTTLQPDPAQVAALAAAINAAETVTIFAGSGASASRDELFALAEKVKAPVGHALGGKMSLQYDNPFDVGMTGLLGYGALAPAAHKANLFLMIGTDFPYRAFLPKDNVAQIEIDASRMGLRAPVKYPVVGDAKAVLQALLPLVAEKTDRTFLDKMLHEHHRKLDHVIEAYTSGCEHRHPIHPEFAARIIDERADGDAIFAVDTGMCTVWGARYITPTGERDMLVSYRHGTMANALPDAIGAQAANPGRQVVSFNGDGGLSMLMGELITVKQHGLPIKMFVFNNSSLGMVKLEMLVEGLPEHETDHEQVDYATIARGVGIEAVRVERPEDLREAVERALAHDGPFLVDMVTDANALSVPPEITWDEVVGFAEASAKTVLAGGVGAMVDMALTNLKNIPRP